MSCEAVSLGQVGDDGGLNGAQGQGKWPDLEHLSEMEITGFPKGLDIV